MIRVVLRVWVQSEAVMNQGTTILSPQYGRALGRGAAVISLFCIVAALVLDGGLTVQVTLISIMGYLGGVTAVACRRPQSSPSRFDLMLIAWGFVPLWLAVQFGDRYAWTAMGAI